MRLYIYVTTASGKEMVLAIGYIERRQLSVYTLILQINQSNKGAQTGERRPTTESSVLRKRISPVYSL